MSGPGLGGIEWGWGLGGSGGASAAPTLCRYPLAAMNPGQEPKPPRVSTDSAIFPKAEREAIARELTGDLPCVRCRYNLRGLSVRAPCPECGTPVRATLLAVVDPFAGELQPVSRPRLIVAGLIAWSLGGFGSALCVWA